MYLKFKLSLFISGLVVLIGFPQISYTAELEEITVTAQKRETVLSKTGLALSAFTGDYLEKMRIERASDIGDRTPGFSYYNLSPLQANMAMRGQFTSDGSPGTSQPIGLFIDEVYMGRPSHIDNDLFGLERVEVLRGPQGTLFGRNVVGGAISIFTKDPTEESEAEGSLTLGSNSLLELKGYFSGKVSENVFGSITIKSSQNDGWAKNIHTGNDAEGRNTQSARLKLRFAPTGEDDREIIFSADATKDRSTGLAAFVLDGDADRFPGTPDNYTDSLQSYDGGLIKDAWGTTLKITRNVNILGDNTTFTSITAYRFGDNLYYDSDLGPSIRQSIMINLTKEDLRDRQFTQELRWAGSDENLTWVAGIYYLDGDYERTGIMDLQTLEGTSWSPGIGDGDAWADGGLRDLEFSSVLVDSIAAFSQVTYAMNDTLSLVAGGRYTRDKKTHHATGVAGAWFFQVEDFDVTDSASWSEFTPKIGLEASWDDVGGYDSVFAFLSYTEGYKSGGYNVQAGCDCPGVSSPVDPEYTDSIELGLRTRSLGNRFGASVVLFSQETEGLQTQIWEDGKFYQDNAGKTSVEGIEVELDLVVNEYFDVGLTYANTDGKYDEFTFKSYNYNGTRLPQTPKTTYSFDASYIAPYGDGELSLTLNFSHKSYIEITPREATTFYPIKSATERDTLNVTASYEVGNLTFTAFGRNLTDDQAVTMAFNSLSGLYLSPEEAAAGEQYWIGRVGPPRTFGLSLGYKF
jgi:iron complex outermembrane receptor protein